MKTKKYIKLKVDMYEDTKFKIIDTMENRDTINYIWTRILALCGKINNDEGSLIISKNIIYTVEILALEFNRSIKQVEDAINVFIDLNMMSKDKSDILSVCNWSKHQCKTSKRIKKEEKNEIKNSIEEDKTNSQKYDIKEEHTILEKEEVKMDANTTKEKIDDFAVRVKDGRLDEIKPIKRKRKKRKMDEITVIDINEDEVAADICGVDMAIGSCGNVVASFDIT